MNEMTAALTVRHAAGLYKALAHPARLRILAMLRGGELCACQIAAVLRLAPSTVSAHLAELRRAGLLAERREGRWIHYGIAAIAPAQRVLTQVVPLVERDEQVAKDQFLVERLRRIPAAALCRVNLDLSRLPGLGGVGGGRSRRGAPDAARRARAHPSRQAAALSATTRPVGPAASRSRGRAARPQVRGA